MDQQALWCDTFEDSLKAVIDAIGGPKRVASMLWPAKAIAEAARYLNCCLDPERAEKLHLSEVLFLIKKGREAGCNTAMYFLTDHCNYTRPNPVDPLDQRAQLQREYIDAAKQMKALSERITRSESEII